jgi:Tfp pilus assembly major pilin PilA
MMRKSLVVLSILSMISVPAVAQVTSNTTTTAAPAKPQTVKKRVCFNDDEDSYSRLGGRKICKTVEVPVKPQPQAPEAAQQGQAANPQGGARN